MTNQTTINVNMNLCLNDLTQEIIFNCSKAQIIDFISDLNELASNMDPDFTTELVEKLGDL